MSGTPRTDAEQRKPENAGRVNAVLPTEFARGLERELIQAEQTNRELLEALKNMCNICSAVSYAITLGKTQQERIRKAQELISRAEGRKE